MAVVSLGPSLAGSLLPTSSAYCYRPLFLPYTIEFENSLVLRSRFPVWAFSIISKAADLVSGVDLVEPVLCLLVRVFFPLINSPLSKMKGNRVGVALMLERRLVETYVRMPLACPSSNLRILPNLTGSILYLTPTTSWCLVVRCGLSINSVM